MNLLSSLLAYTARQIAALRSADTATNNRIDETNQAASALTGRVSTNESNIQTMNSRLDTAISAVTTSTEVTDIRVGDDGVTYQTAGTAVRTQLSNLKSDLTQETNARTLADNALSARVTDNDTDISALQTSVTNLGSHKVAQPLDGNNQPTNGTSGQSLRTKGDGTTEWADVGLPTDEQTAQAVSDWLDDHPEATTTVQDGSLTEAKFSDALKMKAIKDYVTPEMFGAKGDGITDDTNAVQQALNSDNRVVLFSKRYKINSTLNVNSNATLIGFKSGSIITNSDITVLSALNCSFVTIQGMTIEKPCGENYHIVCSGYHHTIDTCNLIGNINSESEYVSGIHFIKPTDQSLIGYEFVVKNCQISVGQIVVDGGTDGYIVDNVIWSATTEITPNCYAVEVKENSYDIKGNQIVPGKLGGLLLQGDPGACLFSVVDNYFDGSHDSVLSGALLVVKDCDQNTLISNNKFYNCYKNAITIDNSPYSLITSNLFINNNRSGESNANDIVFINNQYGARAIVTSNQFANYHTTAKDVFNASTTSTIVFKNNNIIGIGYIDNNCYLEANGVVSENNMRNGKVYAKVIGTVTPINDLWGIVLDDDGILNNVDISKVIVNDVDKTGEYQLIHYWGIYCACKGDAGYLNNAITVIYAHGV